MNEYIERETLKERIFRRVNNGLIRSWLCRIIDELSPADVAPVRHGHWIYHIDDLFPNDSTQECSYCHAEESLTLHNENYCPNCGAKMDAEVSE